MKEFLDIGNKMVIRDTLNGEQKTVAFICYRELLEENRVITGVYFCAPHLDVFVTGTELLEKVREKYPAGEWSLETEPAWCSRPEYLALIQKSIDEGFDFYDVIGEYSEEAVDYTSEIEFYDEAMNIGVDENAPSILIRSVLAQVDQQIAERELG